MCANHDPTISSNNVLEEAKWQAILIRNRNTDVFHLKKFCLNLPPTTII